VGSWVLINALWYYFGFDVTLIRIAWVAGTLLGFGSLVLVYLLIALIAD